MKFVIRTCEISVVGASLLIISSNAASAYIDPGTGSYILQVAVAGLLAAAFVVKSTWGNIRRAFAKHVLKRRDADEQ